MNDKTLMKISFAVSLAGVFMMFFVVQAIQPAKTEAGKISDSMIGQSVIVEGSVESPSLRNGNAFFVVSDETGKIRVVVFERSLRNIDIGNLKNGSRVSVVGKVGIYRSELEIIASSVVPNTVR